MSKLKEEELLGWLEQAHRYFTFEPPGKDERAYQQIKEMIQKKAEQEEIEACYIDIVIDLYDRLEKKSPRVTEEFVRKWADVIHQIDTGLFGIKGELKLVRQMLKEVGVEVVEKR